MYSGISQSNVLWGVPRKIQQAFHFLQESLLWTKGKLHYYINSAIVSWFLRNLHCPSVLRPPPIDLDPHPPHCVTSLFQFALHHEFIQPFFVWVKTWLFTLLISNNYSCESPWNMIFFSHVKYIFAHKMYLSSHGNQVDKQTWFDATLVQRFNEWNQEVTIHRPNILTLLSSAFIRGHPFFSLSKLPCTFTLNKHLKYCETHVTDVLWT